jgi:ATP-dependent HslUV protease, peptidase subunit HslV
MALVQRRYELFREKKMTTILSTRKNGKVILIGDGQAGMGGSVFKATARKVRRIGGGQVLCGFAGGAADGFAFMERMEAKLEQFPDQLMRAAIELAKDWRTEKGLRNLEAHMILADKDVTLMLTGGGDIMEPDDGICAIGSGGGYALAAARGLDPHEPDAELLARRAISIAADICIHTNSNFIVETLDSAV